MADIADSMDTVYAAGTGSALSVAKGCGPGVPGGSPIPPFVTQVTGVIISSHDCRVQSGQAMPRLE
jgi:hypothetical protein